MPTSTAATAILASSPGLSPPSLTGTRKVPFGRIDPAAARELFIRHALVEGDWQTSHRFFAENRRLLAEAELRCEEAADVDRVIERAMAIDDRPVVVDFIVHRDAMVWPMVAAGTSNNDIKFARGLAPDWGGSSE